MSMCVGCVPVAVQSWVGVVANPGHIWRPAGAAVRGRGSPASLEAYPGDGLAHPACSPSAAQSASPGPRSCSENLAGSWPCPRWSWASPHTSSSPGDQRPSSVSPEFLTALGPHNSFYLRILVVMILWNLIINVGVWPSFLNKVGVCWIKVTSFRCLMENFGAWSRMWRFNRECLCLMESLILVCMKNVCILGVWWKCWGWGMLEFDVEFECVTVNVSV